MLSFNFKLETRPQPSKLMSFASPLLALALTVILAALLFAALGKDPVKGLAIFFIEPLNGLRGVSEVPLAPVTPTVVSHSATPPPAIAPSTNWPSAPMFQTFDR